MRSHTFLLALHPWVHLCVETTADNLLEFEHHAGVYQLSIWIMKIRHSKYSFAVHSVFTQMSEPTLNN